ncbi:hypothetical protein AAG570_004457 [Ranatra chinensis]|uniref:Uncharacterized protein n=1 Tax=Ranatra chinensis TaxID=642074 RepID=A0ABD0Y0X1_9HEMI
MASKSRNMFSKNKKQERTEIDPPTLSVMRWLTTNDGEEGGLLLEEGLEGAVEFDGRSGRVHLFFQEVASSGHLFADGGRLPGFKDTHKQQHSRTRRPYNSRVSEAAGRGGHVSGRRMVSHWKPTGGSVSNLSNAASHWLPSHPPHWIPPLLRFHQGGYLPPEGHHTLLAPR